MYICMYTYVETSYYDCKPNASHSTYVEEIIGSNAVKV
jgi:hypothetical protein